MKFFIVSFIKDRLSANLWFVPAMAAVLAYFLQKGLAYLDGTFAQERQAWFLFGGEADSARELLSTIASSVMTFMGLVFSITILVLQLASTQFSPRVLRTFLKDRSTQLAMASFVATFVFAMTLLSNIRTKTQSQPEFVPALSVFVAFGLVLISVGFFIHYLDHMANSVRSITVVKRISAQTREAIEKIYPDAIFKDPNMPVEMPKEAPTLTISNEGPAGVVSAVDEETLMSLAQGSDAIIGVVPMLGDFLPRGALLFRVWDPEQALDREKLSSSVFVTDERTLNQDPAFGFRQLVEIAERALSPGINDPSTAVQAIDELHDLLRALVRRCIPSPMRVDDKGKLRLILPRPDWESYVHLAVDEIRHYGRESIQVSRRLRAMLIDCLAIAPLDRRACLMQQVRLLEQTMKMPTPADEAMAKKPSIQGHGPTPEANQTGSASQLRALDAK